MKIKLPKYRILEQGVTSLSENISWAIDELGIPRNWKISMGENVTVAVIDSGINLSHPDLKDNINTKLSLSFLNYEKNVEDLNGHGTASAGIIASSKNSHGIVGVAPKSKIVAIKALGENGQGTLESFEKSLKYVWDNRESIDIVNMSLGSPQSFSSSGFSILKKIYDYGIPLVAAAGNNPSEGILFPAKYDQVFAIGSYGPDIHKKISAFSARGEALDFVAGGERITTTYKNRCYATLEGTSFSSPLVAGIIALLISELKSKGIKITVPLIKEYLVKNSVDKGDTGWDSVYGHGKIDVSKMLVSF